MATAFPDPISTNSKFLNWVKAALAVLFTKKEIEPVVYDEMVRFQQKCLQDILTNNSLPSGSTCSNCCTENVVKCPTNRICNANRGKCSYHRNVATKYRLSGCPNKICHNLKSKIDNVHRYHGPSYKNTDATQWCSNPWEIAKCFMPPDGYKDVTTAADTDFNGIISVILNHKGFDAITSDDLSKDKNIFVKGRDVGKAVRHCPNLEIEDTELTQYFTYLDNILSDPKFMAINKSTNNVKQKLTQLKNDDLIIGKEMLRQVLEDAGKDIQQLIRNERNEYKIEAEKQKLELIYNVNMKVREIADERNVSVGQLKETLKASVDALEAKARELENMGEQRKKMLDETVDEGIKNVKAETENALKKIQIANEKSSKDKKKKRSIWRRLFWWKKDKHDSGSETSVAEKEYQDLKQGKHDSSSGTSVAEKEYQDLKKGHTMTHQTDTEDQKCKRVIDHSRRRLKKNMIPGPIIDCSTGFELFSFEDRRNIKEGKNTTEKNDAIIEKVRKTKDRYLDFKKRLKETQQDDLVEYLERVENGLDTKDVEKKLDIIAEQRLSDPDYYSSKKELKENLMTFYKTKRSSVPLSPLFEEVETDLAGFYVMPEMNMVKQKSPISEEERTPVSSLRDLFVTGSEKHHEIYLTADAGFGKTSLSKYLAITWCQACCPDDNRQYFKDEEIEALADFEFLFLVSLRDVTANYRIDEMIEQLIVENLPLPMSKYPLQEILKKEKCLIILDGLDEWTHPNNGCSDQNEKVPHRCVRDNCVILTTTRPWKLGVCNLKTSEINKKVELVKLSKKSMCQLEKNAISKMIDVIDEDELKRKTRDFNKLINERGLNHMQTIPLLLMYITCLWCNKIPIGDSKTEVYFSIIEFLLSRTVKKHPEVHPSCEPSQSDIPEYLKKHKFCQEFYSLLTALAEVAYHALFNEKRENSLVFDGAVVKQYLKADDMKLSLLSGILTESTTTTLTERTSKVSFSHKTVQEFFAAIFISSHSDAKNTILEKCKNVESILDTSMICEFISKMNSKMMCEILPAFMSVINEDEETREYRTTTTRIIDVKNSPLYNIQKMLLSCLKEMPESENIKLCLQDFFIDKDTIHDKHLQRLSKLNKTNMKSLYIFMWRTGSLREILELFSLTDLNNLQKLFYRGARQEVDISELLSPTLQTVHLSYATLTNERKFCEKFEALKNVECLDIVEISLCHYRSMERFVNFISGKHTMKELTVWGLNCKEHEQRDDCTKIKLDLSQHSQLKQLNLVKLPSLQLNLTTSSLVNVKLWDINLDESSLLLSRDMLNIESVMLYDITISAARLDKFIKVLEELPQSVTVKMYDIKPETEYERVRKYISRRPQTFLVTRDEVDSHGRRKFEFITRKPSKE